MNVEVLQVTATPAAIALIESLRAQYGPLLFHQSGGCCDGSSPMCYPQNDFIVGDRDVLLGEIGGAPFYISPSQFEYWKHSQLTIDVVEGRGGMFSLENGTGSRFLVRSRLFEDAEFEALRAAIQEGLDSPSEEVDIDEMIEDVKRRGRERLAAERDGKQGTRTKAGQNRP